MPSNGVMIGGAVCGFRALSCPAVPPPSRLARAQTGSGNVGAAPVQVGAAQTASRSLRSCKWGEGAKINEGNGAARISGEAMGWSHQAWTGVPLDHAKAGQPYGTRCRGSSASQDSRVKY